MTLPVRARRIPFLGVLLLPLVFLVALATAARSEAAETIYWNNYSATPSSIGFAGLDGSGGGALNPGGMELKNTEGMAYDSVTNRLFVASEGNNQIVAINLDGSGATAFAPPGAPIDNPEGVTLDPTTRVVYWINTNLKNIAWANLDGSAGGVLNTPGVEVEAYRLAIDPSAGRVYWFQGTVPGQEIMFANTNGSGVGSISTAGASPNTFTSGIATDPAGGRVYWVNEAPGREVVSYAKLDGSGGGGDIPAAGAAYNDPYGLALDPSTGSIHWANYENGPEAKGALGFLNLAGGVGGIDIATAPVNGPQDPVILKTPSGTGAPQVTRAAGSRVALSCSQGTWGADYAGSFVYQAPRSYAYQWSNNGAAIAGATAATLTATTAGSYSCTVTAVNQEGSTAQPSAALSVTAAKLRLTTTKNAKAKVGKLATFKIEAANQGDIGSGNARICVKRLGAAKKALKAPKCKQLGKLIGTKKKAGKLKIKVKPSAAPGTYKLKFLVKGAPGKAIKAKVTVLG